MKTDFWKLLVLLIPFTTSAQVNDDFTKADSIAQSITTTDISLEDLAQQLTASLETETEKARAIYMWVAGNIRYDCRKYKNNTGPIEFSGVTQNEILQKKAAYYEKNVQRTLKWRKGICGDYSRLFQVLGTEAGLEVAYITGHARDFRKSNRKALGGSHAWNAVKLKGKWYLIDATWGSGYAIGDCTRFKRRLSPGYFMVDPRLLIQTHFPKDAKWQLLPQAIDVKTFAAQPIIDIAELKFEIEDFSPMVETKGNNKIIRLKFKKTPKYFLLTNQKSKQLKFTKHLQDGYVILVINNSNAKKIMIWASDSRKKLHRLAMYKD